jgi:PleD family two-component response regulator
VAEVAKNGALTSEPTPPQPDCGASHSVPVVDDQPDAREMLTEYLSSCGFVVHTATDGVDAIEVALRVVPSIKMIVAIADERAGSLRPFLCLSFA